MTHTHTHTHTNVRQKIRVLTGDNTSVLVDVSVGVFSRVTLIYGMQDATLNWNTEVQENNPDTPLFRREPFR